MGVYVSILYCFRDIASYFFNPLHLHLAPSLEFCGDLWRQKTKITGPLSGFVCTILCFAVLAEHRLVTYSQSIYHTSIASRGKNVRKYSTCKHVSNSNPDSKAEYCDECVCVFVCPPSCLCPYLHQIFCAYYLRLWLGSSLAE